MLQEGEAWFGATSTNIAVNVVSAKNDAALVSQSVPASMITGQTYPVSVTMKNTGTTTWVAGTWKLGAQNPMDTLRWGVDAPAHELDYCVDSLNYDKDKGTFWMRCVQGDDWLQRVTSDLPFRPQLVRVTDRVAFVVVANIEEATQFMSWLAAAEEAVQHGYRTMRG